MLHPRLPGRQAQGIGGNLKLALDLPGPNGVDPGLQLALFFDERCHLVVGELFAKARADALEFIQQGFGFTKALFHIGAHVRVVIKLRFLGQISDFKILLRDRFAFDLGIDAGHDSEQSGLARAV